MNKLKTLKDFPKEEIVFEDGIDKFEFGVISINNLREEAKKYLEFLKQETKRLHKEELEDLRGQDHGLQIDHSKIGAVEDWIKMFFNLEEGKE